MKSNNRENDTELNASIQKRRIGEPFIPYWKYFGFRPSDIVHRQRAIGAGEKLLYRRLEGYAGKDGKCFPSESALARDLGYSERHIRNLVRKLENRKLIAVTRVAKRLSNNYQFLWHEMFGREATSPAAGSVADCEITPQAHRNWDAAGDRKSVAAGDRKSVAAGDRKSVAAEFFQEKSNHENPPIQNPSMDGRREEPNLGFHRYEPRDGQGADEDLGFLAYVLSQCSLRVGARPEEIAEVLECARSLDPTVTVMGVALLIRAAVPLKSRESGFRFLLGEYGFIARALRDKNLCDTLRPFWENGADDARRRELASKLIEDPGAPEGERAKVAAECWFWAHPAQMRWHRALGHRNPHARGLHGDRWGIEPL